MVQSSVSSSQSQWTSLENLQREAFRGILSDLTWFLSPWRNCSSAPSRLLPLEVWAPQLVSKVEPTKLPKETHFSCLWGSTGKLRALPSIHHCWRCASLPVDPSYSHSLTTTPELPNQRGQSNISQPAESLLPKRDLNSTCSHHLLFLNMRSSHLFSDQHSSSKARIQRRSALWKKRKTLFSLWNKKNSLFTLTGCVAGQQVAFTAKMMLYWWFSDEEDKQL